LQVMLVQRADFYGKHGYCTWVDGFARFFYLTVVEKNIK
jgi:hypothetical protein